MKSVDDPNNGYSLASAQIQAYSDWFILTGLNRFGDTPERVCVCVCVRACVRACMRACMRIKSSSSSYLLFV